jgi:hypothetical protein
MINLTNNVRLMNQREVVLQRSRSATPFTLAELGAMAQCRFTVIVGPPLMDRIQGRVMILDINETMENCVRTI